VVKPAADGRLVGLALAAFLAVILVPSVARTAPAEDEVRAARRLFAEAEKDEDASRWADALEKLRRVAQVKLTAGIHYHIALCEEHLGQLATALDQYTSAEGQARAENAQDVLALVGKRIEDLGPRVPRLTIRLAPHADAAVALDGARLPAAVVGTALPVDPGEHRIEVTAPDRPSTRKDVTLRERDMTTIHVEVAEAAPRRAVARAITPPSPRSTPTDPGPHSPGASPGAEPLPVAGGGSHASAVLATVGAVALAGGGVAAFFLAGSAHETAVEQCARIHSVAPGACDGQRASVRGWDFAAAGAWLGAAAIGAVAVVEWIRPSSQAVSSAPTAHLLVGPASLGVGGRF
jgi:hypothetical protein